MSALNVGIISQTLVQQYHLRQIVEECGNHVSVAWLVNHLLDNLKLLQTIKRIDVWLVEIDTFSLERNDETLLFEKWLFGLQEPVIFGEGNTYNAMEDGFNSWVRQLTTKLLRVSSNLYLSQQEQKRADFIWVIAASTGGPEAVKEFLDVLPAGLGVGFLYAQHIELTQKQTVVSTVTRSSPYRGRLANHGDILCADTVTIVPIKQELDILSDATLVVRDKDWGGEYRPSIDKVVATVAERFGSKAGTIFFSGMGEDGVIGARLMARRSGRVWIQAAPTCASAIMPLAINRTGCVTASGSPSQLANYLVSAVKGSKESALIV